MSPLIFAKKSLPPAVESIVYDGVEYSTETRVKKRWIFRDRWQCLLIATRNNNVILNKEAYSYPLDPSSEINLQKIYPKKLIIDHLKIPDKLSGIHKVKGITIVDEKDNYHYVTIDP